jgi:hypothetical protein
MAGEKPTKAPGKGRGPTTKSKILEPKELEEWLDKARLRIPYLATLAMLILLISQIQTSPQIPRGIAKRPRCCA